MFFKKLDMISPPITIYFKGEQSHSTIFSGILTVIIYSISLYFGILYTIQFIKHQNPQVYYFNRYIEDAGEFPVNSSQLFSFIQILDTQTNIPEEIDFDSIRIIGFEVEINIYKENNNLMEYNHWIYGKCNNSTDTKDIGHLIDFVHFTGSACIRKYYNKKDKKYYNTEDENFIWPNIVHGCSHPHRTFYGIVLEKCRNDTLKMISDGKYCKPPEQIVNYIRPRSANLKLIDNYVDALNYENPFIKYFYSISSGLFEDSFSTNHLNFNPATLITSDAIVFENDKKSFSYIFQQNEKITSSSDNSGIYVSFYFWMQNSMHYYQRKYRNFQDILSDIGGLTSLLLNAAYIINILVSNYIILYDTEQLLNEIESSKKFSKNIIKNNVYKNLVQNKILSPNNENSDLTIDSKINNNLDNNNYPPIKKTRSQLDINEPSKVGSYSNKHILFYERNKHIRKSNIRKSQISSNELSKITILKEDKKGKNIDKNRKSVNFRYMVDLSSITKKLKLKNNIPTNKMKFLEYISYFFSCGKLSNKIYCFDEFRTRIISEENLILNYLNVCKLLKATKNIIKDIEEDKK